MTAGPSPAPGSEEEAWAQVLAAWDDEAPHRRYLARFQDLEALPVAGARYKAVLAARPGDAMALRMRAEILKKATAYGLAAMPRTPLEPPRTSKWLRTSLALSAGSFAAWCIYKLGALLGAWS
jgi:hypothetical protein